MRRVFFISAGIWLRQYLYEIVDEIHRKAGKWKKIKIFFSFQLNRGLNKGMNIFPLKYMYDLA